MSNSKHNSAFQDYSCQLCFADLCVRAGRHPTLVSPVRQPVHILLLVGGCETQGFAGHARFVVDISVKHIGLEGAAQTDSANPLSKTVWLQASFLAA